MILHSKPEYPAGKRTSSSFGNSENFEIYNANSAE